MAARESGRSRAFDVVLCALFIAAIWAPCVDQQLRADEARSVVREHRNPAPKPELSFELDSLQSFPGKYEVWYYDRFGTRDFLVRWHNALFLLGLRVEPTSSLVAGKDGWLFFREDQSMEVWRGVLPFAPGELDEWRVALERRRAWLKRYGCEYLFVIVPNKEQIYPEHMPDALNQVGPTRLDELVSYMRANSDVRFLDLRRALRAEKAHDAPGDYLFHPLGTHWTSRGAWAASVAVFRELKDWFPAIQPYPRERYDLRLRPGETEDSWGSVLYIDDLLQQPFYDLTLHGEPRARTLFHSEFAEKSCTEIDDPTLPRVLLTHDSFGPWILPFIAEQCSRMRSSSWQYAFPKELVWSEQPQVLIQMFTERSLMWQIPPLLNEAQALDAETFATVGELLLEWDPLSAPQAVEPYRATKMELVSDPPALAIEVDADNGWVLLPAFELGPNAQPVLHLVVDSPLASAVSLLFKKEGQPEYLRRSMFQAPMQAGRNDLYLKVPVSGITGRLLARIGWEPGRYLLQRIEVRAAREP